MKFDIAPEQRFGKFVAEVPLGISRGGVMWRCRCDCGTVLPISSSHLRLKVGSIAVVRRIALSLLKQDTSVKLGMANKRLIAAWDESYLLKILLQE